MFTIQGLDDPKTGFETNGQRRGKLSPQSGFGRTEEDLEVCYRCLIAFFGG